MNRCQSSALAAISGLGPTNDGSYYVEGTFPVALSTPLDPAPSPLTAENAQAYYRAATEARR